MAEVPARKRIQPVSMSDPAQAIVSVTKAASDLPDGVCRGLQCGTAGTVNLIDMFGNTVTGFPLQQGLNAIRVKRVSTGGTASDIWALY